MKEGKIVSEVPKPTRVSKFQTKWDEYALTAQLLKQPVLVATHVNNTLVKSMRQYTRPPFVTDEGRIAVKLRNSKIEDDGKRYGDVYFEWEPKKKEEK
jgi:hypothetical protein